MNHTLTPVWYARLIRPTARRQASESNSGRVYDRSETSWGGCDHKFFKAGSALEICIKCSKRLWEVPKVFLFLVLVFLTTSAHAIDMKAIAVIESSNNPSAINKKSHAVGLYQITPIALADYNQYHTKKYKMIDLVIPSVNTKIAKWMFEVRIPELLESYNYPVTTKNILVCYNAGIKRVGAFFLPIETVRYINKYKEIADDQSI